ncbi:hypothetical protein GQ55_7G191300 [Panicum hallii var. hallii]|uniref:RING-type domain-containing protein n=1 Tax=Panicum hallii var. hallii TaxID=1504633 RepID=A0A2T7CWN3_9POAL|nr:hypothetical protein GQ55_7G191300 [Panicum hallii var. hallii]
MASDDLSLGRAFAVLLGVSSPVIIVVGYRAYRTGRLARGWRRLRVWALGGVTTLEEALGYSCAMCSGSFDAREEVRTLSCDHVFHRCKSDKCKHVIDDWLRENRVACPVCCKVALPVLPWKAPPASAPSASDLEDPLMRQASSPSASSSGSEEPPLPLSTMASGEEPPLSSPVWEESRPQSSP